jgi:hypothetical protein
VAIASPTLVTASGLTTRELATMPPAEWSNVFLIRVEGSDTAVAGRYAVADGRLEFIPAFPLDPGRRYRVELRLDRFAGRAGAASIVRTLSLAAAAATPSTRVVGIDPTAEVWPANLLRVYIHFSNPMSGESGVGKITLRSEDSVEVTEAFLPLETDFWSQDRRRYTVFFDPGRVKRGILPNRQSGRALVDGRRYAIEVSRVWRDANGQPLVEDFRHEFRAGPAIERPMRVEDWKTKPVRAASRDPLVVVFPWPIDRGLADRALVVQNTRGERVPGTSILAPGDLAWSFTPTSNWTAGEYQLSALPILEDPSGNQVGRAFEVDMKKEAPPADVTRTIRFKAS